MKLSKIAFQLTVAGSLLAIMPITPVFAQGTSATQPAKTRAQVVAERDAFLATHEWSEVESDWELKNGKKEMEPGMAESRAKIKSERDAYLKMHMWDKNSDKFLLAPQPRDMSGMSKEQVKMESAEFHRLYVWNNVRSIYVLRTDPLIGGTVAK